jgi:hypothetical protein
VSDETITLPRANVALLLAAAESEAAKDHERPIWRAWWETTEAMSEPLGADEPRAVSALPLTEGTKVRATKGDETLHGVLVSDPEIGLVIDWEIGGMGLDWARSEGWQIERDDEPERCIACKGIDCTGHSEGLMALYESEAEAKQRREDERQAQAALREAVSASERLDDLLGERRVTGREREALVAAQGSLLGAIEAMRAAWICLHPHEQAMIERQRAER